MPTPVSLLTFFCFFSQTNYKILRICLTFNTLPHKQITILIGKHQQIKMRHCFNSTHHFKNFIIFQIATHENPIIFNLYSKQSLIPSTDSPYSSITIQKPLLNLHTQNRRFSKTTKDGWNFYSKPLLSFIPLSKSSQLHIIEIFTPNKISIPSLFYSPYQLSSSKLAFHHAFPHIIPTL